MAYNLHPIARQRREPSKKPKGFSRYGPYKSGAVLEKILDELNDSHLTRKIGKCHNRFNFIIRQLSYVPNLTVEKFLLELVMDKFDSTLLEHIEEGKKEHLAAWTHLRNAMTTFYRDTLRDINEECHQEWLDATQEQRAAQSKAAKKRNEAANVEKLNP